MKVTRHRCCKQHSSFVELRILTVDRMDFPTVDQLSHDTSKRNGNRPRTSFAVFAAVLSPNTTTTIVPTFGSLKTSILEISTPASFNAVRVTSDTSRSLSSGLNIFPTPVR